MELFCVNGQDSNSADGFDVFLCHRDEDKLAVRQIAKKLTERNIKPWLAEDVIRGGTSWQTTLEQQIENIRSAAVFVGKSGLVRELAGANWPDRKGTPRNAKSRFSDSTLNRCS